MLLKSWQSLIRVQRDMPPEVRQERTSSPPLAPHFHGETAFLRLGLAGHGLLCWYAANRLWETGDMVRESLSVGLAIILYGIAFLSLLLTTHHNPKPSWSILPLLSVFLIFGGYWQVDHVQREQDGLVRTTDVWLFADYAARLTIEGENPYTHDLASGYIMNRATMRFSTPLLDGDFTGKVAYPSLSFLLFLPFQWVGISTTLVFPLFMLLTLIVIFFRTPPPFRAVILLPVLATPQYLLYSFGGVSDIVWTFGLVMMIGSWRSPVQRSLWYGAACAFKQQPWFLFPFLLIRIGYEARQRRFSALSVFIAGSAGIFLSLNLPFMIWDFPAWVGGVMEPLSAKMIVLGQGLSSLTTMGYVMMPRWFFSVMTWGTYGLCLLLYWQRFEPWKEAMWLAPGFILWFGHRSLSSYWLYFAIPLCYAVFLNTFQPTIPTIRFTGLRWILPALAILWAVFCVSGIIYFSAQPQKIEITVHRPIEVVGDRAVRFQVEVLNNSDRPFTPRFSVQSWNDQPFFWHIESGPLTLAPQESGYYVVETRNPLDTFEISRGAQIIVTDAQDYDRRGSVTLQGDPDYHYYDAIPNGDFQFWSLDTNTPFLWGVVGSANGTVELVKAEHERARVRISLPPNPTSTWKATLLDTWMPISHVPVRVSVMLPEAANLLPALQAVYGFELMTDDGQRVWILFADEAGSGQLEPGLFYKVIPAPRGIWSNHILNIPEIFKEVGLSIPPASYLVRHNLPYPAQMVNFRLLAATRNSNSDFVVEFGAIHSQNNRIEPTEFVEDALENPADLLLWRAEYNRAARNYDKAYLYYMAALKAESTRPEIYYGLGMLEYETGNWQAAINSLKLAISMYPPYAEEANETIGLAYYQLGQYEEASSYLSVRHP